MICDKEYNAPNLVLLYDFESNRILAPRLNGHFPKNYFHLLLFGCCTKLQKDEETLSSETINTHLIIQLSGPVWQTIKFVFRKDVIFGGLRAGTFTFKITKFLNNDQKMIPYTKSLGIQLPNTTLKGKTKLSEA